ncbi:hypothetical protein [Frateuria sp.]|uniref:hypothetical protein n=1 Tax=Frateuria sp. TaxID=2211372 RepID=UPI00180A3461|nr:hypothetical protein [Frateuria sp.]NUR23840.1 hypothetical protein [Frateuria sp.]
MRRTPLLIAALLLAGSLSLAGCVVVAPRHARVWVPGHWSSPHVWVEGYWRYR